MKRNIIRKNTGLNGISIERQIEIPDYDMTLLKLSTMTPYLEGRRTHKTLDHNKKKDEDPANDHDYVDLGLPSGTLWATCNVGANAPEEYGDYYMYGMGNKTYDAEDTPYDGTEDPLDLSRDTARQVMGGAWHMPTKAQMQELTANTTYQWVTNYKGSGINGGTFTATNGAVLFIPAAGYWDNGSQSYVGNSGNYWSSSPNGSNKACGLFFGNGHKAVYYGSSKYGHSVRGVLDVPIPTE